MADAPVLATLESTDGGLSLVLCPGTLLLRPTESVVREFDAACCKEKEAGRFPIWKHIKRSLVSGMQGLAHLLAGRLGITPLSAIRDLGYSGGHLELLTEKGNILSGTINVEIGEFRRSWNLDQPGLFPEEASRRFIASYARVKALYDAYLAKAVQPE